MQFPSMTPMNRGLVITFVALFFLGAVLTKMDVFLSPLLGLSAANLLQGKIWTLFTYAFLPSGIMECLFDGLIFWFIGSELESMWGQRRYGTFLATTVFGAALIFLAISFIFLSSSPVYAYPLHGPAGVASAMCVTYGILFPERTMYFFFFPLQAKWFVMLLVGMNLYHGFFSPGGVFAWSQIGAMASAFGWMTYVSNPQFSQIKEKILKKTEDTRRQKRLQKNKKITKLHIVEDDQAEDDDNGPTYH